MSKHGSDKNPDQSSRKMLERLARRLKIDGAYSFFSAHDPTAIDADVRLEGRSACMRWVALRIGGRVWAHADRWGNAWLAVNLGSDSTVIAEDKDCSLMQEITGVRVSLDEKTAEDIFRYGSEIFIGKRIS